MGCITHCVLRMRIAYRVCEVHCVLRIAYAYCMNEFKGGWYTEANKPKTAPVQGGVSLKCKHKGKVVPCNKRRVQPHGIGQLVREPCTFPHPLPTVRCSFKQRRLGVCRAESGSVSDIDSGARRPSLIMPESVYDVFIFIRGTFTNRSDRQTRLPRTRNSGLLLEKRGF